MHPENQNQQNSHPHLQNPPPNQHESQQLNHPQQLLESNPNRQMLKASVQLRTNRLTWFSAAFCMLFGIIVLLGGLAVLIVYLLFRPRSPHFDISTATLNAAYIDSGSLLNADITILANFTNPNKKIDISFDFLAIDLYYGNTLIATGPINPFSERRAQSKLANVHMIASQVHLPLKDSELLKNQMVNNSVLLEVRGSFRTWSNYGNFLHLRWVVNGPRDGPMDPNVNE
ncbi:uncharacterized protein At1g08160-like [Tasmannia lanceolata]|uniref:uncharacterized protein At1g08160-like n=1 Tax=Tasmannia lanceolata TaxID=3420 RepID=UPI004062A87F